MAISQEIHRERKKRGWSMGKLAEETRKHGVYMSKAQISDLEGGKSNPGKEKLEAIGKAFGLDWKLG